MRTTLNPVRDSYAPSLLLIEVAAGERVAVGVRPMKQRHLKLRSRLLPGPREPALGHNAKSYLRGDRPVTCQKVADVQTSCVRCASQAQPPSTTRPPAVADGERKIAAPLAKQTPDAGKRQRADFIVDSSQGLDNVRAQVRDIARLACMLLHNT
jgi:hypothetical protein